MGGQALAVGHVFGHNRIEIEGFDAVDLLQDLVLLGQRTSQTLPQTRLVQDVDYPDPVALGLVRVGGADAATGGPDPLVSATLLHRLIQQAVVGHGHVGRGRQPQVIHGDAVLSEHVQLTDHDLGVHNGAGTNQADGSWVKNAGGNQVQFQHLVVHNNGVTGIHTALVADDHIGRTTQEIGDLALPLVTPLSTDDDNVGQGHSGPQPLLSTRIKDLRWGDPPSKQSQKCVDKKNGPTGPLFLHISEGGSIKRRGPHRFRPS